jgi:hypothetical protein
MPTRALENTTVAPVGSATAGEASSSGVITEEAAPPEAESAGAAQVGNEADEGAPQGARATPRRPVHRLRDLSRQERIWALAVAAGLLLAPVAAYLHYRSMWTPSGDPALMGLRVLDVGTTRTPLLGQPSASGQYAQSVSQVHHPGAIHFYLMALPVRLLGGAAGMLLTSVAITGTALVVSAWATFRQLGRRAGLVAAVVLALIAFTTGFAALINPVSSNIAGYPLLVSAVLLWCVACGDTRLLPAATAAVSFTALQHLSVVPATLVITVGALALAALTWWRDGSRHDPVARRDLRWGAKWSAVVAAVMWAPVLAQEVFGNTGNLGMMLWFARHGNEDKLGFDSAARQVAHTLGLPPFLGRTELRGSWLNAQPSAATWLSAAAVVAVVGVLTWRWRHTQPRRARLGAMAGIVTLAGLYNGASVPQGIEQFRMPFYHWTFVLAFFVALVVGLAAADLLARVLAGRGRAVRRPARLVLAGAVVVAVFALPLVNMQLDRSSSRAAAVSLSLKRYDLDQVVDEILDHRDELGKRPVLLTRHEPLYGGTGPEIEFALAEHGIDVLHPLVDRFFVHDQRLVHRETVDSGLMVVLDTEMPAGPPIGVEKVADVTLPSDMDLAAYRTLVTQAQIGGDLVLGPDAEAALASMDQNYQRVFRQALRDLKDHPANALMEPQLLAFLRDHPVASPALDPKMLRRQLDGLPEDHLRGSITRVRVYLLDRADVLRYGYPIEIGAAPR